MSGEIRLCVIEHDDSTPCQKGHCERTDTRVFRITTTAGERDLCAVHCSDALIFLAGDFLNLTKENERASE